MANTLEQQNNTNPVKPTLPGPTRVEPNEMGTSAISKPFVWVLVVLGVVSVAAASYLLMH